MLARLPRGAVAEFPFYERRIDFHIHTIYMVNSTRHWQPLLNGYSDYIPPDFRTLAVTLASFPSRRELRGHEAAAHPLHRGFAAIPVLLGGLALLSGGLVLRRRTRSE